MRVITVSRTFPGYHPKAGQPTYFVEKILRSLGLVNPIKWVDGILPEPKHHTIRSGNRWKGSFEVRDSMINGFVDNEHLLSQELIYAWIELPSMPPIPATPSPNQTAPEGDTQL